MRIIRVIHAGSFSIALALAMIGLGGGCDDTSSTNKTTTIKEDPKEAAARGKTISEAYKANPPDSAKKAAGK